MQALKYCPEAVGIVQLAGNCKGVGSIALDLNSAILSKIRASVEALVTWHLIESLKNSLASHDLQLLDTFSKCIHMYTRKLFHTTNIFFLLEVEMKSLSCLAYMEVMGIKIDKVKLNFLITTIQEQMACLQQQAFSLAGRRFSFTSSKEVAKVFTLNDLSTNNTIYGVTSLPAPGFIIIPTTRHTIVVIGGWGS